jgi:hypothetical protein
MTSHWWVMTCNLENTVVDGHHCKVIPVVAQHQERTQVHFPGNVAVDAALLNKLDHCYPVPRFIPHSTS